MWPRWLFEATWRDLVAEGRPLKTFEKTITYILHTALVRTMVIRLRLTNWETLICTFQIVVSIFQPPMFTPGKVVWGK